MSLFEQFSADCRKMFYTADPVATRSVEQIIKKLPAGSKASYTKQMASIRSQFHRDSANSRRAEVDKLLLNTLPSSAIIKTVGNDSSLGAMRSPRARQERLNQLRRFIDSHCVRNMVGVHPFFSSLCTVLHLMSLPARKGGSGKRRVEWDIDLVLFCETGGEPFLKDSIQFLKGVLGFEDYFKMLATPSLKSMHAGTSTDEDEDEDGALGLVIGHSDGDDGLTLEERQELEVDMEDAQNASPMEDEEGPFADSPTTFGPQTGLGSQSSGSKDRNTERLGPPCDRSSFADPFSDPTPELYSPVPQRPHRAHASPRITVSSAEDDQGIGDIDQPQTTPSTPKARQCNPCLGDISTSPTAPQHRRSPTQNSLDEPPPAEVRIFRSPSYLTTPELREMIQAFPSFISVRCKSLKFDASGQLDGNEATYRVEGDRSTKQAFGGGRRKQAKKAAAGGTGFVGHGVVRISVFEKDEGWKGTFFERIKLFIYRTFGI